MALRGKLWSIFVVMGTSDSCLQVATSHIDFGLGHVTCFGWGYVGRSGSDWVLSLDIERPGGLPMALWGPCPCQEKCILWAGPWLQEEDER